MGHRRLVAMMVGVAAAFAAHGVATEDLPISEPDDAVMPALMDVQAFHEWAKAAFTGEDADFPVSVRLIRQDFNSLRFGESCMETPITIGAQTFEHGLGTHANSEIAITIPAGATEFRVWAGIDNNYDTQGTLGTAIFTATVDGTQAAQSPVLKGGDAPHAIAIDLPVGSKELILHVETTEDGPGHDQADWADAQFTLSDGAVQFLDEGRANGFVGGGRVPFSFVYGGRPSAELLPQWKREIGTSDHDDHAAYTVRWTDPDTALNIEAEIKVFKKYPAIDWVLRLTNGGAADTPIIENVQALDLPLLASDGRKPIFVHQIRGDNCSEASYQSVDSRVERGGEMRFAPQGGRSSNGTFPFFDLEFKNRGIIAAVGWSGQWAARVARDASGPAALQAGMEQTHLVLHAGETIRTPRILLMTYAGDRVLAYNQFRRLMLFHYVPKHDGRPVALPIASQCFDRYSWTVPEWATEKGQIDAATFAHEVGFDTHWFDAAWFPGGFPGGVGNWFCKPDAFPRGLKPVTDAIHAMDMRFVLWFEPERVGNESQIAHEHPEFVHGGAKGGLYKLDDPEALKWITDLMVQRVEEYGLDVYRQDFNMDPLDYWRKNDAPDRQGMTEIRFVEGLYSLWDTLLAKFPGLLIDNCSSGGRRIDLETCMRAVPFWRSDTNCSSGHVDWNQAHTAGLSRYVPLHMSCTWTPDAYATRSSATAGLIAQWDYMNESFPHPDAKKALEEVKTTQKFWYGDFYPIVAAGPGADQWSAYQLHRPDLDAGVVYLFRRGASAYTGIRMALGGIDASHEYVLEFVNDTYETKTATVSGDDLLNGWELTMPEQNTSLLVRYRRP